MLRQGDAQVVHDAVGASRQRAAVQFGKGGIAEIKEGGNRNHRTEYLEAEHKPFNQVGGNFLQAPIPVYQ
ncbi:hypothetical protein D3C87_1605660 [compost metagenome]